MRSFICTTAIAALTLVCLSPNTNAAEIDFEYRVYAVDVPLVYVSVLKRGRWVTDSLHYTMDDAHDRIDVLEADGYTATHFTFRPSRRWIIENSELLRTFDDLEEAADYADIVEAKTGMFTYIETVEVIPGGP